jgi:hypothetical protein
MSKLEKQKVCYNKMQIETYTKEEMDGGYFTRIEKKEMIIAGVANLTKLPKKDKLAQEVLNEELLEKDDPKHFCRAELFYPEGIELIDLNGNPIPQDTPNVLVMIGSTKEQRIIRAIYKQNVKMLDTGEEQLTLTNVVVKEFSSVKECAKYIGVNNLLDRTMKANETVKLASIQNEQIKKIFQASEMEGVNINIVIKASSSGKAITPSLWRNMAMGKEIELLEINLEKGKEIISEFQRLFPKKKREMNRFVRINFSTSQTKLKEVTSLGESQQMMLQVLNKCTPNEFVNLNNGDTQAFLEAAWDEIILSNHNLTKA